MLGGGTRGAVPQANLAPPPPSLPSEPLLSWPLPRSPPLPPPSFPLPASPSSLTPRPSRPLLPLPGSALTSPSWADSPTNLRAAAGVSYPQGPV